MGIQQVRRGLSCLGGPACGLVRAVLIALPLIVLLAAGAVAQPKFPELTGRVVDLARLLKPEDVAELTRDLAALEAKSTDQVVVVTLPSLQGYSIEDFGYQLGRKWGIGQAGKDNGVLLIIAPNDKKVRIEVGRRLEPLLTDLMSKLIIDNAILPGFRRGDFPGGIKAGVRDIRDVLLGDAEAVKQRAAGGKRPNSGMDPEAALFLALWIAIVLFVIYAQYRQARQGPQQVGSRRGRGPVIVPGGWGGSGNWGGGWSGGGGGNSGGGWSGGGGDFGGGGASGSW